METSTDTRKVMVQARLAARARRITVLRRRVVAGALASFVLAWGAIATTGSLGTAATVATTSDANSTAASAGTSSDTTPLTPVSTSQS